MYENDRDVAAYAVIISCEGEVVQPLKLENITKGNRNPDSEDSIKKEGDLQLLKKFIVKYRPHVVAVGSADRKAVDIRNDVDEILKELNTNDEHQFPQINCFLMDDNLAKVYANSERGNQDFREYPNILKQAVSIARRMQDPLIEFSQLTGPENEITSLRYHPMQDCLTEEELLEGLTTEFINRTNEVGVDINECVAHPYMSYLVQFVGGLGPRKGAWLLKTLRQMQSSQRLENRQQLVTLCHMGPKVLINCAGFIKIDTSSLGDSEVYVEVLDGSRIHNEAYEWARKMAVDALEYDEEEGNPANALEEILNEPEKLSELDLDAFATELERQGFGKKSITLCDIRSELCDMYKDLRTSYSPPEEEEIFNLVTKETPETFWLGKLVMATVIGFQYQKPTPEDLDSAAPKRVEGGNSWQCPFCGQDDFPELTEVWNHFDAGTCPGKSRGIRIRLDNQVTGFIKLEDLSDSAVISPEQRVQIRQSIYCRITQIKPDRFQVDAACKSSVLEDKEGEWKPKKDDYYDHEAAFKDEEKEADKKQQKQRQAYTKRVIVHPSFYNIGYKEAEENMKNMDQGEVIIRPSSKVTITNN
jgi:transcription elongation factor SPT6